MKKKTLFNENEYCEQLIAHLMIDGKVATGLESLILELQKELKGKYCSRKDVINVSSKPSTIETNIHQPPQNQSKESSDFWLWVAIIVIGVLLLFLIVYIIFFLEDRIKRVAYESQRLENKFAVKSEIEEVYKAVNKWANDFSQQNKGEITKIKETLSKSGKPEWRPPIKEVTNFRPTPQPVQPSLIQSVIKYPKAVIQNGFRDDLSDNQGDSYFEFFDINGNNAKFRFCGKDFEKAKANKDTLDIVCDISGTSVSAYMIENEEAGSVILKDGKWEVITKAKIKFV